MPNRASLSRFNLQSEFVGFGSSHHLRTHLCSQIDADLLEKTWNEYNQRSFELDRLRMSFYAEKILASAKCST
jgi:hypothetical protein